jgi:ribonuclease III
MASAADAPDLAALESVIGVKFGDRDLLLLALAHRSALSEASSRIPHTAASNERLEFLGDAVLAFVSADYLYRTYPQLTEGELSEARAALVREESLAEMARQIDLGRYLILGRGEDLTGGRARNPLIADAFEALIGAIMLDRGLEAASGFILRFLQPEAEHVVSKRLFKDPKSTLQELAQLQLGIKPTYVITSTEGPPHDRVFLVEVHIGDHIAGTGSGRSRKLAERAAALAALEQDGWVTTSGESPSIS